jgi:hypothetical protein
LDLYVDRAIPILDQIYERETGQMPVRSDAVRQQSRRQLLALLVSGCKEEKLLMQLPGAHVHAMCHAAVRWDQRRNFKENDFFDFHHAEAALGYCDVFLTDGPMKVLLTANHVALDRKMDCVVLSEVAEAVACLRRISTGEASAPPT